MKNYFNVFIIGLRYLVKKIIYEDNIHVAVFIIMISLWIPYEIIQTKSLNRHTAYAVGVIYKINSGRGLGKLYKFYVGDSVYIGSAGHNGLSKIVEGDSIVVIYDYTNPDNNEIVAYYEYKLDRSKLPDTVYYRQQIDKMRKPLKP